MKNRLDALAEPDEIYEENAVLEPINKGIDNDYSKTMGGGSKFGGEYRQEPLYRTGFPTRDNYIGKPRLKNDVSQLGINSQLVINASANRDKERSIRSELLA